MGGEGRGWIADLGFLLRSPTLRAGSRFGIADLKKHRAWGMGHRVDFRLKIVDCGLKNQRFQVSGKKTTKLMAEC